MVGLDELATYVDGLLETRRFRDYTTNGLQVEGRERVGRLVGGVTASLDLIEAAAERGADALIVHHGYFWKNEDPCIRGMKRRRLGTLLANDISLLAYHLPLDAHPVYGNNIQLARLLGIEVTGVMDTDNDPPITLRGELPEALPPAALARHIGAALGREPLHIPGHDRPVRTLGWCTGAAQDYIEYAVAAGVDAFISGEVSERTTHVARESGVHYFAAGHHATERGGVQALGAHLAEKFDLEYEFVEIDNPV